MADIKVKNNSGEVLSALKKAKKNALEAIGSRAETYAKAKTPVDTGRLRNSITHIIDDDAAYIGTNVEYAPYVELGTRHNKAHHMLQKAATEHREEYKAIAKAAFRGKT